MHRVMSHDRFFLTCCSRLATIQARLHFQTKYRIATSRSYPWRDDPLFAVGYRRITQCVLHIARSMAGEHDSAAVSIERLDGASPALSATAISGTAPWSSQHRYVIVLLGIEHCEPYWYFVDERWIG